MGLRAKEQLSVELTDTELRLLWFIPGKNKRRLNMTPVTFTTIPLSLGIIEQATVRQPTELTRILEQCRVTRGIKGRVKVRIGIPLFNGFIREYLLPWVPKHERFQLLSYLADEEIPIPANERIFDSFVVEDNPAQKQFRVILSGIRETVISQISSCFQSAGFHIERIEFSAIAWARMMDFGPEEHNLLLKEHSGLLQLLLYKGQIPEIIRTISPPLKICGDEEWRLEIQRILAYFSTLNEQVEIQRIIAVEGAETQNLGRRLCEYLMQEKGIPPLFQTLDEGMPIKYRLENRSASWESLLAVTGMALENYPTANNFWRGETRRRIGQRNMWIAAILLFVLTLAGFGLRDAQLKRISELEREVQQLKGLGEGLSHRGHRQGEQTLSWKTLVSSPTTVGKELTQLQGLTGKGIQFQRLDYQEDLVIIQGTALDPTLVQNLIHSLQNLGWENTRLKSYAQNQGVNSKQIEFTLSTEPFKK